MAKSQSKQTPNTSPSEILGSGKDVHLTFEQALIELEERIEQLERDDLTLDSALAHFEQGIHLMRSCDSHLKGAQGKIKELLKGENGKFIEKTLGVTLDSFIGRDTSDE